MARRRYQNGCLLKRGKNWVLRYREDVLSANGSVVRVHRSMVLGQFPRRGEAKDAAEAYLRQIGRSVHPQTAITLEDFWVRYFEPDILPTLKTNTRKLYRSLFARHLLPILGQHKLREISRVYIQQLVSLKHRQGYSTQTLAHLRNLLGKVLGTAASWGWLQDNQARGVKLPPWERRRFARVLSIEEVRKLSEALEEPARTLVIVGVLTGLRIGELLGLQVLDVDLSNGRLYVNRTVCRGEVGTTKTPTSKRDLPLPPFLVDWLGRYLTSRGVDSEWLFPTSIGTFQNDRTLFLRKVKPVCERLGIVHFSWHSMRHTFATFVGNDGVTTPILQTLLGHTNYRTTARYTHVLEDSKRQAVSRLSDVLFPNVPKIEDSRLRVDSQYNE